MNFKIYISIAQDTFLNCFKKTQLYNQYNRVDYLIASDITPDTNCEVRNIDCSLRGCYGQAALAAISIGSSQSRFTAFNHSSLIAITVVQDYTSNYINVS